MIRKKCLVCDYPAFAKGYCKRHQYLRTDKKPVELKRSPIKRMSNKKKSELPALKEQQEKDWNFYLEIWDERPHFCFETGAFLGNEPFTLYFHHVLEKGLDKYKKYRYCKWNIVLLTWEQHTKVGNNIDLCPRVKSYTEYLIKHLPQIENGTFTPSNTPSNTPSF